MYDWPEIRAETDALWAAIRDRLRARNVPAPETLSRDTPLGEDWRAADLVLSQTCGLPLVRGHAGPAHVVGQFDLGLDGCDPGWYRSALVVPKASSAGELADLRGKRLAVNDPDSQSGTGSVMDAVAHLPGPHPFFGSVVVTGAHAASIRALIDGAADIAAIDAQSWRLARRWRGADDHLRVICWTRPTPGLPLLTGPMRDPVLVADAVAEAVNTLDRDCLSALGIRAFVRLAPGSYDLIAERDRASRSVTSLHGL